MAARKKSARQQRIESEMQRVLAELIAREVRDPRVGHVTITAVEMLADMSAVRVLFVPFAAEHSVQEVRAGLTRAAGFLRGEIGRRLSLRHAPRLEFVYDESIERAQHLSELIESAVASDRAAQQHDAPDPDTPPRERD